MRRVNQRLLFWCGAAGIALASAVGMREPPASNPGQTAPSNTQSTQSGDPKPAATPDAAAAERERAMIAAFTRGDSSWSAAGADAQRSSWVRTDQKITKEGVQKPDFKFLWKLKLAENGSR